MDERQTCWTSAVLWMVLGPPMTARRTCQQNCGPWQFYGWFWALTKYQKQQNCWTSAVLWMVLGPLQQNCWTSAVLWMVLGPKESMLSELQTSAVLWMVLDRVKRSNITADLSSFMDDFGPNKIIVNKTADLGSSMDYFSQGRKLNKDS